MITAIIQARVNSTRFFNKVFAPICGEPLIYHVVNRLKKCKKLENIVLATSINELDNSLFDWSIKNGVNIFRGSEDDVLLRFFEAASFYNASIIVRITADDPFKDPEVIDSVINELIKNKLDFAYNNYPPSYPEGLDVEVFTFSALEKANKEAVISFDREHVTQFFYKKPNIFIQKNYPYYKDISLLRWTVDTKKDYEMVTVVYDNLYQNKKVFLLKDVLQLLEQKPEISEINLNVKRSTMYSFKK